MLPVEVTPGDLCRMGLLREDEAYNATKKAARALMRSGHIKSFRAKTGLFTLAQRPNGDCMYLDSRRQCTIYDRRPTVCRRFPEIGPRPGHCPVERRTPQDQRSDKGLKGSKN